MRRCRQDAPQDFFEVAIADGVAHLQLNRPDKLNSMNRAFWSELPAIVRDIDDNARARVIVISSTGKHFSAGMDLERVRRRTARWPRRARTRTSPPKPSATSCLRLQDTFSCLDEARIPVIAAIQGGCIGGARRHDLGLRHPLLHGGRVLLHPGDQPRP